MPKSSRPERKPVMPADFFGGNSSMEIFAPKPVNTVIEQETETEFAPIEKPVEQAIDIVTQQQSVTVSRRKGYSIYLTQEQIDTLENMARRLSIEYNLKITASDIVRHWTTKLDIDRIIKGILKEKRDESKKKR